MKPTHPIDLDEPLDTDRTDDEDTEIEIENTPEIGTIPCRDTAPNREVGELENPAKRPHIEPTRGRGDNPTGEGPGADYSTQNCDHENEHTTQNWTQHVETEEQE